RSGEREPCSVVLKSMTQIRSSPGARGIEPARNVRSARRTDESVDAIECSLTADLWGDSIQRPTGSSRVLSRALIARGDSRTAHAEERPSFRSAATRRGSQEPMLL